MRTLAIENDIDDHVVSSNRDERIVMSPAVGMKINIQGTATPTTSFVVHRLPSMKYCNIASFYPRSSA